MPRVVQASFVAGEIAPTLILRKDLNKINNAVATARNFLVQVHGGLKNRAGFKFITEVRDSSKATRLVPFEFSTTQSYILEFGDQHIRFYRDGGQITESGTVATITNVDDANPVLVTAANSFTNGNHIWIAGTAQDEINGRRFTIQNRTAAQFELVGEDGTGRTSGASGGTASKVYELGAVTVPYLEADLFNLRFVQSADVLTIVHPSYAPRNLTRTADDAWTLTTITFEPSAAAPTGVTLTGGSGGTGQSFAFDYVVTAVIDGEESLPAISSGYLSPELRPTENNPATWHRINWTPPTVGNAQTIEGATQNDPVVITITAHGYEDGDRVWITGETGMTEINDRVFFVANKGDDTFELRNEDGSGHTAANNDGTVDKVSASKFIVYKSETDDGVLPTNYGFIGESVTHEFFDDNIAADDADTARINQKPFDAAGDFPRAVAYFQQRRIYGGTNNTPQGVFMSVTGAFDNFSIKDPLQDDDSITFVIAAQQVNVIEHIVALRDLIIFTTGGEWRLTGNQDGAITPAAVDIKPQSSRGSHSVRPLELGSSILYVQRGGQCVRDLAYTLESDGYQGRDLTVLASHLVEGFTIVDWDYAQTPDSVVWCVRSDGKLLALTFLQEHDIFAWTQHDTDGEFESVASVPETADNEDAVYAVVKRTVNGSTVRYVERLEKRDVGDVRDSFFVDSGLTWDSPVTITAISLGATTTITAAGHGLANGDFVDLTEIVGTTELNDTQYKVANVSGADFDVTDQYSGDAIDSSGYTAYVSGGEARKAVSTLVTLQHLEGESVSVLANGNVERDLTVTSGKITLQKPASRIHVGLPITADIDTLGLEYQAPRGTAQGIPEKITRAILRVDKSRGFFAGPDSSSLTEAKWRSSEDWNEATRLLTGEFEITPRQRWTEDGKLFVRQEDPLPLNVLGIILDIQTGD